MSQLNLLAKALRMEGRYDEARELYERSLAVREECLGKWHPNVATSLNNLGSMLTSIGVYNDAEPLLQRALEIDRKVYGMEHPRVATDFNNLAVLYNGVMKARPQCLLHMYSDASVLCFRPWERYAVTVFSHRLSYQV